MSMIAFRRTLKRAVDVTSMQTISSDALVSMNRDDYQIVRRAATRARLERTPRYLCECCGYAVYAPLEGKTGKPYWKHHLGAPQSCPWWTGKPSSIDAINAKKFDGIQESPLHARLKTTIGDLLSNDPRTTAGSVIIDEYLIHADGRRRPDVRAIYDGEPLVVEVQLSTTQIPIIIQREDFYENASIRLLWLTWNFDPPFDGRLLSSFEDIFYSHDKNLFSIDDQTIKLSRDSLDVFLRAFWIENEVWRSKLVRLSELDWTNGGRANAVPSKPLWHRDFILRWRSSLGARGLRWEDQELFYAELIVRLFMTETDVSELRGLDIEALINCMLSLIDGKPVGSRQQNLVEVLNSFFNVERRKKYSRLIRTFAHSTGRSDILEVDSVKRKLRNARIVEQADRDSVSGKIAVALFPEMLLSAC